MRDGKNIRGVIIHALTTLGQEAAPTAGHRG